MDEEKRPEKRERRDKSQLNAFENLYENFRNVPLKYLDMFIGLGVAALVLVIVLGIMNR